MKRKILFEPDKKPKKNRSDNNKTPPLNWPFLDAEATPSTSQRSDSEGSSGAGTSPSTPPSSPLFFGNSIFDDPEPSSQSPQSSQSPHSWLPTPDKNLLDTEAQQPVETLQLSAITPNAKPKLLAPNKTDASDEHPHKKYNLFEIYALYNRQIELDSREKENDSFWINQGVRVRFVLINSPSGKPELLLGLEGRPSRPNNVPSHISLGKRQSVISAGTITFAKDQSGDIKIVSVDAKSGGYCQLNPQLAKVNLIHQLLPYLRENHPELLAPTLEIVNGQTGSVTHRVETANAQPTASPNLTVM